MTQRHDQTASKGYWHPHEIFLPGMWAERMGEILRCIALR